MSNGSSVVNPVKSLLVLGLISVLFLVVTAPPAGASQERGGYCAGAIITPSGKISLIWASQVSCRTARKVSRPARRIGIYTGRYRYSKLGFSCRGTFSSTFTDHVTWKCRKGFRKKVSFYQT